MKLDIVFDSLSNGDILLKVDYKSQLDEFLTLFNIHQSPTLKRVFRSSNNLEEVKEENEDELGSKK